MDYAEELFHGIVLDRLAGQEFSETGDKRLRHKYLGNPCNVTFNDYASVIQLIDLGSFQISRPRIQFEGINTKRKVEGG